MSFPLESSCEDADVRVLEQRSEVLQETMFKPVDMFSGKYK